MNKHLERIKAEDALNRKKVRSSGIRAWAVAGAVMLIFGSVSLIQYLGGNNSKGTWASSQVSSDIIVAPPWNMILVNNKYNLPKEFSVKSGVTNGVTVDSRILKNLSAMVEDAKKDGIALYISSGYIKAGDASKINESPAAVKEHATGLAIDISCSKDGSVDTSFANSEAYIWLCENAKNYGFIERYPEKFKEITNVFNTPWHYRFVGDDNAEKIGIFNMCMEEYCAAKYDIYKTPEK